MKKTGETSHSAHRARFTVIVIDDDASVLKSLGRLIRLTGYNVYTFERPSVLLAADLPAANACMLVDVNLAEMNGVELCEELARSGRDLPVIFMTGSTDASTKALTKRVPATAVLIKPFDEHLLFVAISKALKIRSKNRKASSSGRGAKGDLSALRKPS